MILSTILKMIFEKAIESTSRTRSCCGENGVMEENVFGWLDG